MHVSPCGDESTVLHKWNSYQTYCVITLLSFTQQCIWGIHFTFIVNYIRKHIQKNLIHTQVPSTQLKKNKILESVLWRGSSILYLQEVECVPTNAYLTSGRVLNSIASQLRSQFRVGTKGSFSVTGPGIQPWHSPALNSLLSLSSLVIPTYC